MNKHWFLIITLFTIIACNEIENKPVKITTFEYELPPMELDKSSFSWDADVKLNIQSIDSIGPGITSYTILSRYKNLPVGFKMILKKQVGENQNPCDRIKFLPMGGDTSNRFLEALSDIYLLKTSQHIFKDSVTASYCDLSVGIDLSNPGNQIAAQFKLFFSTDENNPELYLNIFEKDKYITLPEKDSSYRKAIIQSFSKKAK